MWNLWRPWIAKKVLEKEQSWKANTSWFENLPQSYSNENYTSNIKKARDRWDRIRAQNWICGPSLKGFFFFFPPSVPGIELATACLQSKVFNGGAEKFNGGRKVSFSQRVAAVKRRMPPQAKAWRQTLTQTHAQAQSQRSKRKTWSQGKGFPTLGLAKISWIWHQAAGTNEKIIKLDFMKTLKLCIKRHGQKQTNKQNTVDIKRCQRDGNKYLQAAYLISHHYPEYKGNSK